MNPDAWVDVVSAVFMIAGATLSLGAAIGTCTASSLFRTSSRQGCSTPPEPPARTLPTTARPAERLRPPR